MKIKKVTSFTTIGYNKDCSIRYLGGLAELADGSVVTVYASIQNGKGYDKWTQTRPVIEVLPQDVEIE